MEMNQVSRNHFYENLKVLGHTFDSFQNGGNHHMGKLAILTGMYVMQCILALIILWSLTAFTPGFQQSGTNDNPEPRFSDVRIVELRVITKPAQGVKINHVPRNQTSTFIY